MDHPELWTHLAEHHGVVSTRAAGALGVRPHELTRLVRVVALEAVARGTFRATAHPSTFLQRVEVARVAASQGDTADTLPVAAARETATWLWGIEPRSREPGVVHVVTTYSRMPSPSLAWIRVHRSRTLAPDHVALEQGTWVTTAPRTIVDSAINRSAPDLAEMTARGLQRDLFDLDILSAQLEVAGRIRGSVRLREAVRRIAPDVEAVESVAEAAAAQAFADAGLDLVPQYAIEVDGRCHRIDFAAPACRLAVEIDGHWWHSTPQQKARDDRRQNSLVANGWRVLRFGAGTVMRNPAVLVEGVRSGLETRWSA